MKRTELEKENTPKRKQPRKSVSKSRVSFGSVSVHHYEKVETSPTPEAAAVRIRLRRGLSRARCP